MNFGKWSQPGVPKKGWTCTYIEDLEDERIRCEMCEHQEIRFVHYMEHPRYPEALPCGCDCAGRMEDNYANAEARDKQMRNTASRRKRFADLKSWKYSRNGNPYLKKDGYQVTVFRKSGASWDRPASIGRCSPANSAAARWTA